MSGPTFSKRSSPSSRLMELTIALPWQRSRACSRTRWSVESSMSGTFTLRVSTSRKAVMSASSSRSGFARQTSRTCAPPRTCRRPISAAWSRSPPMTSSLNLRLPMTFVRSPTMTGRRSSSMGRTSMPETTVRRTGAAARGRYRPASSTSARTCSAVVPQQPPMMFTQPSARKHAPRLGERPVDAEERGLHVERVLLRLEEEDVGAALDEPHGLLGERRGDLVEGDAPGHRDGLGARTHGAGDEARALGRLELRARRAGETGGGGVDLAHLVRQPVLRERDARAAEGVGLDDVGARGEVALVHLAHDVGSGEDEVLVAALVGLAAEVPRAEVAALEVGPRRPVQDEDALGQEGAQAVGAGRHRAQS